MSMIATGQISIVDLNDSRQLQLFIGSNQPKTQIYNPNDNTYIPNWTSSKPILTPQLFVAGSNTDIISSANSITWYEGITVINNGGNYTIPSTGLKTLTINSNILSNKNSQLFVCEVAFTDPTTGVPLTLRADFEFTKVSSGINGSIGEDGEKGDKGDTGDKGDKGDTGQNAVIAVVWNPDGNMIKNSQGTLKAKCDVYSGSTTVTPSSFKWYEQDATATASSGGDADGGNGWRLLTSSYNKGVTGYTTSTITIPASAVSNLESYKCIATYNTVKYSDVCTVVDVSDPISVVIVGVNTFKNGQGDTTLTAKLYRDGDELDSSGSLHTYRWSLYNADGTQRMSFGTSGIKTGKTITVSATDVDTRANLICEVD